MLTNMPTGHSHTCLTSLNSVPIIQSLTILGILHA